MNLIGKRTSERAELVSVANDIINGQIHLIEGVRKICSLRHTVDDPDNSVFMPIRAIESETDHFPLGEIRSRCAVEYLERIDAEMKDYLDEAKQDILDACNEIINTFS
ncbi:MAG: DUF2489 domain-containing protein [Proteobacteria bacterium]|nr:DUF2489 domain-containing protein [Pseudomonadota bacterium]MBU1059099.1 DUF2489 domain-containing protein [Pseudomonadota bacterium]